MTHTWHVTINLFDTDDLKVAGHPEVVSRPRDEVYQDRLRDYLTSGSAFVLVRQTFANESEKTRRALESHPVIKDVDGFVLRSGNIVIPEPEHSLRQRPSSSSASTPPGAGGRGRSRHHGAAPAAR